MEVYSKPSTAMTAAAHKTASATDEPASVETAHQSEAARVAAALRRAIVRCEMEPGDLLSEADVSRRYGVSRQPVREAFIRLVVAQLVEVRPKSGTRVRPIEVDVIHTARFVRDAVEVEVVRRIAERGPTRDEIAELKEMIAEQRACEDASRFLDLDEAFHRALARMADAADAWAMIDTVKAQMDRVRYLSMEEFHRRRLIGQHSAIIAGLAKGNADQAVAAMRTHLSEIVRSLTVIEERHPQLFIQDLSGRPKRRPRKPSNGRTP
ncbi:MAG: GntR family transcriptional regulator [Devosia sp.]